MALTLNPVLDRELKERVRGWRAAVVITVYLGLLSLLAYAVYWSETRNDAQFFGGDVSQLSQARTGRTMFDALVIASLLLACFIVPGLTAAGIAGERDRQTLVPLQVTLLRPSSIVIGKLLAALSFLVLLLVATVPLMAMALLLGGVTVGMIVKAVAMIALTGVVLGALSLACSALFRRVQAATVAAYAVTLALLLGTFIASAAAQVYVQRTHRTGPRVERVTRLPLWANPLVATAIAVDPDANESVSSPLAAMSRGLRAQTVFDANGNQVRRGSGKLLVGAIGIDLVLIGASLLLAARRLRTPKGSDR